MHGSLALFGTYTVDEEKRTLTFKIEGSTFPNLAGVAQTRTIDVLSDDEFRNTSGRLARCAAIAANIYKRAK